MQQKTTGMRVITIVLAALVMSAIAAQSQVNESPSPFGGPMASLAEEQIADFLTGLEEFDKVFTPETGLGPIFNATSCAACHTDGGIGGGSAVTVTRFGRLLDGKFDPLLELGGSLLQQGAIDPALQEIVPAEANVIAQRRSTPLFGLGLIEAIPDSTILANTLVRKAMGVGGRPAWIVDVATGERRIGRFGWKAQHATLLAFAADASVNELGISNRVFPQENQPNAKSVDLDRDSPSVDDAVDEATGKSGIDRLVDFMRYLAPPEQLVFTQTIENGERWFNQVGCHQCHVKVMFTGRNEIPALDRKPLFLFSDLLLHDMGSLSDGIAQGAARPREIRTSLLWGLRMQSSFLHDGRASTVEAAILMHDGEAAPSRELYIRSLPRDQQLELLEFLLAI